MNEILGSSKKNLFGGGGYEVSRVKQVKAWDFMGEKKIKSGSTGGSLRLLRQ